MKLKNLIAMPVAVALDVATIGIFEVTDKLRSSDRAERESELIIAIAKLMKD